MGLEEIKWLAEGWGLKKDLFTTFILTCISQGCNYQDLLNKNVESLISSPETGRVRFLYHAS